MSTGFCERWYRKMINNNQEVMIYSKVKIGKICANWHQYKDQEEIVKLIKDSKH